MAKKMRFRGKSASGPEISTLSDDELLRLRARLDAEIRSRGLRCSVGEIGESLTIGYFNSTPRLPKLLRAPRGTKNVDALSREGERYSIKTVLDAKKTGTIYPDAADRDKRLFEHLLIVRLSRHVELEFITRLTWEQFVSVRQWDSRMNAWYVGITRKSMAAGEVILASSQPSDTQAAQLEPQTKPERQVVHPAEV